MTAQVPPFGELIAATRTSAVHLEMRDAYTPSDEEYLAWRAGKPVRSIVNSEGPDWWFNLVRANVARGVKFRRARVVSFPR